MGFLFVEAAWAWDGDGPTAVLLPVGGWVLGLLVAASTALYASGVVLNDVFDLEQDRQDRPDRPLPSARISLRAARWLGWESMLLGAAVSRIVVMVLQRYPPARSDHPLVAWLPALIAGGLCVAIAAYNAKG